jgi:hypothetical protein
VGTSKGGSEHRLLHAVLRRAELARRRGRQPDHPGVETEGVDDGPDEGSPRLDEVVDLVEHQRPRTQPGGPVDDLPAGGVQQVQQVGARVPPDRRPPPGRSARGGVVLDVLVVGGPVPGRQRLVGQDGQRPGERGGGAGGDGVVGARGCEGPPLLEPLGLHDGLRGEDQRAAGETPGRLQPDHGLPCPRGRTT